MPSSAGKKKNHHHRVGGAAAHDRAGRGRYRVLRRPGRERRRSLFLLVFFFNDTAPTEIYTLSLHDALPIFPTRRSDIRAAASAMVSDGTAVTGRSEEHTSELQSRRDIVCRLLLEKKKE